MKFFWKGGKGWAAWVLTQWIMVRRITATISNNNTRLVAYNNTNQPSPSKNAYESSSEGYLVAVQCSCLRTPSLASVSMATSINSRNQWRSLAMGGWWEAEQFRQHPHHVELQIKTFLVCIISTILQNDQSAAFLLSERPNLQWLDFAPRSRLSLL